MHWYGWDSSPWWWVMMAFMMLFWLVLVGGIIWLIVYLTKRTGSGPAAMVNERPIDILKKRYARGEISREQFERMKQDVE